MADTWQKRARFVMQMAVSLIVLAAALYVVLSDNYSEGTSKWAYGMVGAVFGYWIK